MKLVRDRTRRSITLSQELYIQDLVKRHGQLIVGISRRFDSPFDATLDLSPDQSPQMDSPEYKEMEPYREAYIYVFD